MVTIEVLHKRAALLGAVRRFFGDRGYLEVETPQLLPAMVPEAYIEPLSVGSFFLQTSPELCMKRLLARGLPRLFQVCKCFRRGERGRLHLPEFTMLEWYRLGADYRDLMAECEALLGAVAEALATGGSIECRGRRVALAPPWERLTVAEAFARHAALTVEKALDAGCFEEVLVTHVEPQLGFARPTLLYDFPAALGSLARLKAGEPQVAERFELYLAGLELANGFSELTDAVEQRERFEAERERIRALGREPGPMPEKFLDDLEDLPSAAGIALGLDRLLMLFAGVASIDEVVAFTPEEL